MEKLILTPPVAFALVLLGSLLLLWVMSLVSAKGTESAGKRKPYACGEDYPAPLVQPDYSQFFAFAFFFTIMHVVGLVITLVPRDEILRSVNGMSLVYLAGAAVGLFILLRKND